jgi:hypothetical protein
MITNEPDIDRVWSAMLDHPAPPLPTADETLSAARGSARRTTLAFAAAGVAGAVVVATVGVSLALGQHQASDPSVIPGASTPSVGPSPARPLVPPPPAPGQAAADQHGKQNAALLMGAVPAGLTGLVQEASPGSPAWTWQFGNTSEYASTVYVVLTTGRADGELSVTIRGGTSGLGTDPCSPTVTKLAAPGATGCEVVDVDGVAIGVVVSHNGRGQVITAIRMLAGGLLIVDAQQGIEQHTADGNRPPDAKTTGTHKRDHDILGNWPGLPAPPLTVQQVTTLAANPGLLP